MSLHNHTNQRPATPGRQTLFPAVRQLVLAGLFAIAAQAEPRQPPAPLTLDDCLRLARERSLALANARNDVAIAGETVRGVRAQVWPSLDASARYVRLDEVASFPGSTETFGRRNNYSATLAAEQLLYSGGGVSAALRMADAYTGAVQADAERVEADLTRRVTHGFFEVLFLEDARAVAVESARQLAALADQTRRRFEAGTAPEFDWLSAQVARANEEPRVIAAENALALGRLALRDLLFLEHDDFALDGALAFEPPALELQPLVAQGLAARPEIRQAVHQTRIATEQTAVARSEFLPEIRAFAAYGGADPSERNPFAEGWEWEWSAGVRLQWSLLDGGRRGSVLTARRLEHEQAENNLVERRRAVALEIESAWRVLQEARRQLASARETVALAERALAIAQTRFDQGLATYLHVTDGNLALKQARLNLSQAQLACRQSLADLRYSAAWPEPGPTTEPAP